ncbi:ParA family protein [Bilifractor sp. LCP19S3_H10]|uniref:ParA family protein n=1 Tax=Bilifractor sp. LCP19S3_H10 TaxID=3438736 RepID=UPI003F9164A0
MKKPIKIAFGARKGGVGKSTLCANIAGYLEEEGHRTLIVVCDDQDDLSQVYLQDSFDGIPSNPKYEKDNHNSLADVLLNGLDIHKAIYTTRDYPKYKKSASGMRIPDRNESIHLHILPAGKTLSEVVVPVGEDDDGNEQLIFTVLDDVLAPLYDEYEYILFDMATSNAEYSGISLLALGSADYVIVPLKPSPRDANSISLMADSIAKVNAAGCNTQLLGAVLNLYKKRESSKQLWLTTFRESLGNKMFQEIIFESSDVDKAETFGVPLCSFTSSRVGNQMHRLEHEIIKKIGAYNNGKL